MKSKKKKKKKKNKQCQKTNSLHICASICNVLIEQKQYCLRMG